MMNMAIYIKDSPFTRQTNHSLLLTFTISGMGMKHLETLLKVKILPRSSGLTSEAIPGSHHGRHATCETHGSNLARHEFKAGVSTSLGRLEKEVWTKSLGTWNMDWKQGIETSDLELSTNFQGMNMQKSKTFSCKPQWFHKNLAMHPAVQGLVQPALHHKIW